MNWNPKLTVKPGRKICMPMLITALAMLFSLISCSDENLLNNKEGTPNVSLPLTGKGPFYMAVRLELDDEYPTRVDYDDGTTAENNIMNLMFLFFDDNGKLVMTKTPNFEFPEDEEETDPEGGETDPDNPEGGDDSDSGEPEDETVNDDISLRFNSTVVVNLDNVPEDFDKITTFLTIVNYDPALSFIKADNTTMNLSEVYAKLNSTVRFSTGENIMTTSGKYDDQGKYIYYDSKDTEADRLFYTSKNEALKNTKTVYVERLAAKVNLKIMDNINNVEVLYGTDVYNLIFLAQNWGLEGEEKEEYLFKNHLDRDAYTGVAGYPSDFKNWSYSTTENHRTFWAHSKTYNNGEYPGRGDEGTAVLSLKYNTFANITLSLRSISEDDGTKYQIAATPTYTTEHTFAVSELTKETVANPYAVPTSIVIKGRYTLEYKGTDEVEGGYPTHPDDKWGEGTEVKPTPLPRITTTDLQRGFYIRFIDMERTDKNGTGTDGLPEHKRYKYRLYLEYGKDNAQSNELQIAMLREQVDVCTREEKTIKDVARDEDGNIIKDPVTGENVLIEKTIFVYTPIGTQSDEALTKYLSVENTYERKDGKIYVTASNAYTLQINSAYGKLPSDPDLYMVARNSDGVILKDANGDVIFKRIVTGTPNASAEWDPQEGLTAEISIVTANRQLQSQLGYAQYYWEGRAFFYAPILHYNGVDDKFKETPYSGLFNYVFDEYGNPVIDSKTGRYKISHSTGDFGVVRNHSYEFTINRISSLGYGIPGNSYIPLPEPRIDHRINQFDLTLKILPWNQFEYTLNI